MDYKHTLNLPKTDFAMKAELPKREPERLAQWEQEKVYQKIRDARKSFKKFIMHDGPPYANGDVHVGTALNKILKDVVVKYHTMKGEDAPYVPGWDCHGTPIEIQMLKSMGIAQQGRPKDLKAFRKACREYAEKYIGIQREQFKRLGVFGDWEHPYLTMDPGYTDTVLSTFVDLLNRGLIYRGFKPVLWCPTCVTALAEAEVEYEDHTSPSVYVKFPLVAPESWPFKRLKGLEKISVLIWTTTPWTLPANVAVAVHPDADYVLVEENGEGLVLAKQRVEALGISGSIRDTVKGAQLEGLSCDHPLLSKTSQMVLANYVTMTDGTGCVHTAPGHGKEDYETGLRYHLGVPMFINDQGLFNGEEGLGLVGVHLEKANPIIVERLREKDRLWKSGETTHSYPHCWRCHRPVMFRATRQWFLKVEELRGPVLNHVERNIRWVPEQGKNRMKGMMETRPDWCLSRQRSWGAPIPVVKCGVCDEPFSEQNVTSFTLEQIRSRGVDAWFEESAETFVPVGTRCSKGHVGLIKETDILDVWFDAACSHLAVLAKRPELQWPADVYLEGSDQHRGWFQVSLLTAQAMKQQPPMKTILTHGFIVDEQGKKMSKSKGNFVTAQKACDTYGADIIRLWACSEDYQGDIRLGEGLMEQMKEAYRKIRNTCRFALSNLYDYRGWTPSSHDQLTELDRYALHQLSEFIKTADSAYDQLAFYRYVQALKDYCIVDLSSFYFDIVKDRLYTSHPTGWERQSAQWVLLQIVEALAKTMAPVLPYTAEEVWSAIPGRRGGSVHEQPWPIMGEAGWPDQERGFWNFLSTKLRPTALNELEVMRKDKKIGKSLEAELDLSVGEEFYDRLAASQAWLPDVFVVSEVTVLRTEQGEGPGMGYRVTARVSSHPKCGRCWKHQSSVGSVEGHPDLCDRCGEIVKLLGVSVA